jgi:hypothetical protein
LKVGVFEEGLDVDEEFAHGGDDGAFVGFGLPPIKWIGGAQRVGI